MEWHTTILRINQQPVRIGKRDIISEYMKPRNILINTVKSKVVTFVYFGVSTVSRALLVVALICQSLSSFGQEEGENEVYEQLMLFEKYYKKEKFRKAAPIYEWLIHNATHVDEDFYKRGLLIYDFLYAGEADASLKAHYKHMLDTLSSIVDKDIEEVYYERFEKYGQKVEEVNFEPVDGKSYYFDEPPEYKEGMQAFYELITGELKKSRVLKKFRSKDKGYVEFIVNADGRIINVRMIKGFRADIDQEIVRIVSSQPD